MREIVLALLMTPLAMAVSIKTFWGVSCNGPFEELSLDGTIGDGTHGYCTESQDELYSSAWVYNLPNNPNCNYDAIATGYERSSDYDCAVKQDTTSLGNNCFRSLSVENFEVSILSFCCQGKRCKGPLASDGLPGYLDSESKYVYLYDGLTKYPKDLGGLSHKEFALRHGRKVLASEYFK